ncbi:MarR family transcriptional regulator [Mycobacterium paraense]|uniref:MarR family transcriptional regulator n=1 Tax=Mycobacterium paraense TaxID=767916 RepID=A0A1X2AAT9_9MYCO|nr:MarR family transcriptional regulator [Mycobacterium paraense]MCV7445692.1 MarR family transcriptional regulator [Mycobacterium paraense]ORW30172.1 MarR family transcriptional regulator [Mycobacterium paraense]ORW37062.1 MarR family transcriptional regulator [Mycobacterium paraense]ORW39779.1 MarR family transcriptional regulator [Mycobacterium paraense]ORW47161.1 MarR family transcriptional regulator [Mycobacterium paraense]
MSEQRAGIAELDERIPFLLAQLGSYISSDFQRRLAPIGADPRTYAVLVALASDDGQSQRQLSERLGIHRNAMVTVIDNLEQQGLAKRLPHPDDRRAVAVTLTAKARRLLPALHEQGRSIEDQITAPLSAKESATLRRLLQRVAAGAGLIPGVHPQLA